MRFPNLGKCSHFALDTETSGLKYPTDRVFGFSISTPFHEDYYWDIRQTPAAVSWLRDSLRSYNGTVVMHNASFDTKMISHDGVDLLQNRLVDTVILAALVDENLATYSLDYLARRFLGEGKHTEIYAELAVMFGGRATKNMQMPNLVRAPPETVAPYAKRDTRITLRLYDFLMDEVHRQDLYDIVAFEHDLMPHLIRMEMHGIRVDVDYAEEAAAKIDVLINRGQKEIDNMFGTEVNVNSSPQVRGLFEPTMGEDGVWRAMDGTPLEKTPKGAPQVDAAALRNMTHDGAAMILEQRSLIKTANTFLRGHVAGSAVDGRVYPSINQSKGETGGVSTGRLSYQAPAMQQIPSRNKRVAGIVKPCFLPDEGHVWVDTDLASFEVRVFAHLANDQSVIDAYKANPELDFHQLVADLTNLVRNATYAGEPNAKQLNLSMIFNQGKGATAEKMGMDWFWDEFTDDQGKVVRYKRAGLAAMQIINKYHRTLPGVQKLANRAAANAKKRGYIFTRYGRHIRFPLKWTTYKASGLLIQATSADINKENIRIISETLNGNGRLLLNVHDSYSMSLPEESWNEIYREVKSSIERPALRVPILLELNGTGTDWWDALSGDDM